MLEKLRNFMCGRNGLDQIAIVFIIISFVLRVVSRLLFTIPLRLISIIFLALAVMRALSKNLAKKREENYRFLSLWGDIKQEASDHQHKRSQRLAKKEEKKQYKFFVCPDCKSKLRVCRGKGEIQIICPRCGRRFKGKS